MSTPIDGKTDHLDVVSVGIGVWAVASAPKVLRTLLGSCVGVVLHERQTRVGGLAHVVLPASRGSSDHPGKFADTAIPALVADLERLAGRKLTPRLTAKLFGGASMFQASAAMDIGRQNQAAVESALGVLGIPVVARDLGGESGRRLTFSVQTGIVAVKIPGGADYEV